MFMLELRRFVPFDEFSHRLWLIPGVNKVNGTVPRLAATDVYSNSVHYSIIPNHGMMDIKTLIKALRLSGHPVRV